MKIGLALAGGGARGAYQIGVWKALKEEGLDTIIDCYAGASVGSLNAILFAMGDYEYAEQTWLNLEEKDLFTSDASSIFKRLQKEKLNIFNKGLYDTEKLTKLLDESLKQNKIKGKDIFVSVTHLGDKESSFFDLLKTNYKHFFMDESQIKYTNLKDLDYDGIKKTVLASCAIPLAFEPITIGKETFYDGGILDNIPTQPLVDAGCDLIIVIDLFKYSPSRIILKKDKVDLVEIRPSKFLRGIMDFKSKHLIHRFEQGYLDGQKVIPKIKKYLNK